MNDHLNTPLRHWFKSLMVAGLIFQPMSALAELECVAIADNDYLNGSQDVLVLFGNPQDKLLAKGGSTGTQFIEAVSFGPEGYPLYAANGYEIGTVAVETDGSFTPIGTFGTGMGTDCADGQGKAIEFSDVDALAFYKLPGSGVYELYATHRREHGANALPDILFQVPLDENGNPIPNVGDGGYYVPGAFGGSDFVCVTGGKQDVDDMVQCLDETGTYCDFEDMYVTLNDGNGENSEIAKLNVQTGVVSDVIPLGWNNDGQVHDVEGITSAPNGPVYGTIGNGGALKLAANLMVTINLKTGEVAEHQSIVPTDERQQDYEAVACRDISKSTTYCKLYAVHDEGVNDTQIIEIHPVGSSSMTPLGPMHKKRDIEGLAMMEGNLYGSSGSDQRKGIPDGAIYQINRGTGDLGEPLFLTGFSEVSALGVRRTDAGEQLVGWARGGSYKQKTDTGPILIDLDTQTATLMQAFPFKDPNVQAIAWSADGDTLYVAKEDGKFTAIMEYDYDGSTFTAGDSCKIKGEVEAMEGQDNGYLLVAIHGKKDLGILALDVNSGEEMCPVVASRKFENVYAYNDLESIALPCPNWLDENSGEVQIELLEVNKLTNDVMEALWLALGGTDQISVEGQLGSILAQFADTMFIASPVEELEGKTGTVENASVEVVIEDGEKKAYLTYTIGGEEVAVTLMPKPVLSPELQAILTSIDSNATMENGTVELMIDGQVVRAAADFVYTPPLADDTGNTKALQPKEFDDIMFKPRYDDPGCYPDGAGDGIVPDWEVVYQNGASQLFCTLP